METSSSDAVLPKTRKGIIRRILLGAPRDLGDPSLRHKVSLIAFLAWVGLGADGLSSSAYGPDIAYRTLGERTYLAIALAAATALTVFVISYAYSQIIEHFPMGGGGYVVASALLGKSAGVVSGCALLVDYVLTVATSIAACGDSIFSLLSPVWHPYKLVGELVLLVLMTVMNMRGVRESVTVMVPIFLLFLGTHAIVILGGVFSNIAETPVVLASATRSFSSDLHLIGPLAMFLFFLRAYSLGGGTYTGIEAVSNGLGIMRDPKVETGKRTMQYMAVSLATTAGGLILCYMLIGARPVEGQTLNAVLAFHLAGGKELLGFAVGNWFVWATMFSEAVLLIVAAQAGFIDGPRVMANMAGDSWLPRRLSSLSDRLTTQNGILLVGFAAGLTLLYTRGHIETLLVMYSLNVFLTFTLSQLGMVRLRLRSRGADPQWKKHLSVHSAGLLLCFAIFNVMLYEKFAEGAWVTVVITAGCVALCVAIRQHYRAVAGRVRQLDQDLMTPLPQPELASPAPLILDTKQPTAGILVGDYNGLGLHVFLSTFRLFPNVYKNVVFISVGVINSDFFRDQASVAQHEARTREMLDKYVQYSRRLGVPAQSACRVGTDIVKEASELCVALSREFPRIAFFAGECVPERPPWFFRTLHNETAYAVQRQIRFAGLPMIILPVVLRS